MDEAALEMNGRIQTMKTTIETTIDGAGRIVIPKEVRREAGIQAAMAVQVRCHDGRIEIEPAPISVTLTRRGRLLIAQPPKLTPPLSSKTVEGTLDAVRGARATRR